MTSTIDLVNAVASAIADAVSIGASVDIKVYVSVVSALSGHGTDVTLTDDSLGDSRLIEFGNDEGGNWVKMMPKLVRSAVSDGIIPDGLAPFFDEAVVKWNFDGPLFASWTDTRRSRIPKDVVERASAIHAEIMTKVSGSRS